MVALRLKERLEFDVLKTVEDRLAYAVVQSLAKIMATATSEAAVLRNST